MKPIALALVLAAACLAGCGGGSSAAPAAQGPNNSPQAAPPQIVPSIFEAIRKAESATAYFGDRTLWMSSGGGKAGKRELTYTEHVSCDGQGHFAIDPLGVRTPQITGAPLDTFQLLQKNREAFLFRYRDFHIRDSAWMHQNYVATDTTVRVQIAGRNCEVLRFERRNPQGGYSIAVDDVTNVILRWEEFDAAGVTTASMEFTAITFAMPPASTIYRADLPTTPIDPNTTDASVLGFVLRKPALMPGYQLAQAERLDAEGRVWARLLYHDGIEPLFFMHSGRGGAIGQQVQHGQPDPLGGAPVVRVFQVGTWTVAQCSRYGSEFIIAGKLPEKQLVAILKSALP